MQKNGTNKKKISKIQKTQKQNKSGKKGKKWRKMDLSIFFLHLFCFLDLFFLPLFCIYFAFCLEKKQKKCKTKAKKKQIEKAK